VSKYAPGLAPAGYYPVSVSDRPNLPTGPLMPLYDPAIRDFARDGGVVLAEHPVDHEVSIRVGITQNMVRSAPDGLDLAATFAAPPDRRAATLDGAVRARLADMVSAGKIRILAVRLLNLITSPSWRLEWELLYVNLQLPGAEPSKRKYASR